MQLLGSSKKVIDKNKGGEIVPRLETVDVFLVHCNLVNNNYQQATKVLFTFVPNKQFGQLINITPHSPTMLETTNAEFSFIEIWFTGQNNRSLEFAKTAAKRIVQKSAEATGDLIGKKIADKFTSLGKLKNKETETNEEEEIIIPPEKRQQIINDLRLL